MEAMMRTTTKRRDVCLLLVVAGLLLGWSHRAKAAEICFFDGSFTVICVPAPAATTQFGHDTRVIDTGQQHQTGTYLDYEEIKRTKEPWPLP
jgi:hypothetical protein